MPLNAARRNAKVLSFVTNAPFKNVILQHKLEKRSDKFTSPYWLSVKVLRMLRSSIHPSQKRAGVIIDKGNVPYNVKRMPSKHTLAQRIKNADLLRQRSRTDLQIWFNLSQTIEPDNLKDFIGKTLPQDAVTGKRIENSRFRKALLSVAARFSTNLWITQEDALILKLQTKPDIQPVAVSYTASTSQQTSPVVNRMKSFGIFLPSLSRESIQTVLFYNLDHFVDTDLAHKLRDIYPYKIFQGKREDYAKGFAMDLLRRAIDLGYTSPFWYGTNAIEKRGFKICKDEFFEFKKRDETCRFYNQNALSGSFYFERSLRYADHFSLYHRLTLPKSFFLTLTQSVQDNGFTSNYWVTIEEIRELGLKLRDGQRPTHVRGKSSESGSFLLYNIVQTVPLQYCVT